MSISFSNLTPGSWVARWGACQINVDSVETSWHVRVRSCVRGVARIQIAKPAVFATSVDAIAWACDVLRQRGAIVFVDGRFRPLETFLAFTPAPSEISCG